MLAKVDENVDDPMSADAFDADAAADVDDHMSAVELMRTPLLMSTRTSTNP